jgi:hypothetical protein
VTPEAAVQEAREAYVVFLQCTLDEVRGSVGQAARELLVQLNADPSTCLKRLMRIDVVSGTTPSLHLYEARTDAPTPVNLEFEVDTMGVTITDLLWHDGQFAISPAIPLDGAIDAWFDRWLDQAETRSSSPDQLSGVIHCFTRSDEREFSVDFGSASSEAFWELLDALQVAGVQSVRIHSGNIPT